MGKILYTPFNPFRETVEQRRERIDRIRAEVKAGRYLTDEKWNMALEMALGDMPRDGA